MKLGINSNLVFALEFLDQTMIREIVESEKIWSSEIEVRYTSRISELSDVLEDYEFEKIVDTKIIRDLSSKEKLFVYEILRLMSLEFASLRWLLDDYVQLLNKRGFQNNERYFYLTQLTDNLFSYELDTKLMRNNQERRYYYRLLNSKFGKKQLTFKEILERYFFTDFLQRRKPQSKRVQRHKGYRDHGSLGSEFSRTLQDQKSDWSIIEAEEKRQKKKADFIELLLGLQGHI